MTEKAWDLVVAGTARRALDRLPDKIALAVLDYLVGPLLENPHRVDKPLRGDLVGLHSARVGAYRIVYEIDKPAGQYESSTSTIGQTFTGLGRHLPASVGCSRTCRSGPLSGMYDIAHIWCYAGNPVKL